MNKTVLFLICLLFLSGVVTAAEIQWPFLDKETIGASEFIRMHPECDGRGVVIIVCDTGVDMGVNGLKETSEGHVKVIEARDFSGQGDIFLEEAECDTVDGRPVLKAGKNYLSGYRLLDFEPLDSIYWMGEIDEHEMFRNSDVADINNNGKTDDLFLLLTFAVETDAGQRWVIYVDENADGHIEDEAPFFDYAYRQDTFTLKGRDSDFQHASMTFAMTILEDDLMASLHVPDGAHGSHCAGIAAGFNVFNRPGNHGIAPGGRIISAKIGDNRLAGGCSTTGSMKKAFDFGVRYAREHNMPVVFSMSYGIGSEIEGRSDVENYLNQLMEENDHIVFVTSNGNEGPGISSTGNPAAAHKILSVGAMLPRATARDVYGYNIDKDVIFHFSSRGGEVFKPDCLAPGAAVSTVPGYAKGERMWGTSMACPQVAGAAAVLISACLHDSIPWNGALIQRAIQQSAISMKGYTAVDQGRGIVNIPRAYEIIKELAERDFRQWPVDYKIETVSPVYADQKGRAAYWRTGDWIPERKQKIKIKALFDDAINADEKHDFFKAYTLITDKPWIRLDKKNVYIKSSHDLTLGVQYDMNQLREPGLYVGTVTGYPQSGTGKTIPEFEILQTIIVPHVFHADNQYQLKIKNKSLRPGQYHRYFVLVPPGASAMRIELKPAANQWSGTYAYLFDPEGLQRKRMAKISDISQKPVVYTIGADALMPGIWEIVPYAFHNLDKKSTYDLNVSFQGIHISPDPITDFSFANGDRPKGCFDVMSRFHAFTGTAQGELAGYERRQTVYVESDAWYHSFTVPDNISHIRFDLSVDKETFNQFTDVAVNISDNDLIVKRMGMGNRRVSLDFWPAKAGDYRLEVIAGFALPGKQYDLWDLNVTETWFYPQPVSISVEHPGKKKIHLFPQLKTALSFELEDVPRLAPDDFNHVGEIQFVNDKGEAAASVKIQLEK